MRLHLDIPVPAQDGDDAPLLLLDVSDQDTLNRFLRPFKLRLTLAPIEPARRRRSEI